MELLANSQRISEQTDESINRRIRLLTISFIEASALDSGRIESRLAELDEEWDLDRAVQTNAATVALSGLVLGLIWKTRFLILSGAVMGFLLHHSVKGCCPAVMMFRRMGFRTAFEIEQERQALRLLQSDLVSSIKNEAGEVDVERLLAAVGLSRD